MAGMIEYASSGLMDEHLSLVGDDIVVQVCHLQHLPTATDGRLVVCDNSGAKVTKSINLTEFRKCLDVEPGLIRRIKAASTSIYKTMDSPLESDETGNVAFKRYADKGGDLEIEHFLLNACAAQRLFFAQDRFVDAATDHQFLSGRIESSAKPPSASDDFVRVNHLLALLSKLHFGIGSMAGFLAYFYDLGCKDEALDEITLLNSLHIEDEIAYKMVHPVLKSPRYKFLSEAHASMLQGSFAMSRLDESVNRQQNLSVNSSNRIRHSFSEIESAARWLMVHLVFQLEDLASHLAICYDTTRGYVRPNHLRISPAEAGLFRYSTSNLKGSTQRRKIYKIFNLQANIPEPVEMKDGYVLVSSPDYESLKHRFYRSAEQKSLTFEFREGAPPKFDTKVEAVNEGEMLWTHSLVVDCYSNNQAEAFDHEAELVALLLSFFTGKPVYTEISKLHRSHKGELFGSLAEENLGAALGQSFENLGGMDHSRSKSIFTLLDGYRETAQNSIDSRLTQLWSMLEKVADLYGVGEPKLDSGLKQKIDTLRNDLSAIDGLDGDKLADLCCHDLSLIAKVRALLFDVQLIHSKYNIDRPKLQKAVSGVYSLRGSLSHSKDYLDKDDSQVQVLFHNSLFLSALAGLVMLGLLEVDVDAPRAVEDINGFINDPDYFSKRSKEDDSRFNHWTEALDYLGGKRDTPPSSGTTIRL